MIKSVHPNPEELGISDYSGESIPLIPDVGEGVECSGSVFYDLFLLRIISVANGQLVSQTSQWHYQYSIVTFVGEFSSGSFASTRITDDAIDGSAVTSLQ